MKRLKLIAVFIALVILGGCVVNAFAYPFLGRTEPPQIDPPDHSDNGNSNDQDDDPIDEEPEPDPEPEPEARIPRPEHVRGLYISGYGAGYSNLRDPILDLIANSELNSLVINVKDDNGNIAYQDTQVQLAIDAGAPMNQVNMEEFFEILEEHQIYPIARIVVFKDTYIGEHKPEWALKDKNGNVWKQGKNIWIDPRHKDFWEYIIDLSIEAAEMGFGEIQYDYVRWPSDGAVSQIADMPPGNLTDQGPYERTEAIAEFLAYAKERLEPYNVEVSADIFGLIGSVPHEMNIGQQLELLLETEIDLLSPMIYPGHYANGSYGLANPNRYPYETVYHSTKDYLERMEAFGTEVYLRPWIQDFNDWHDPSFHYGEEQIRAQIRALRELSVTEYLMWNAGNRYNQNAYTDNYND